MFIHVMLRKGRDDDIKEWYEALEDKSGTLREVIRAYIRLQNGESQEKVVQEAVTQATASLPDVVAEAIRESQERAVLEAVTQATAHLPTIVAEAVRDALAAYQLTPAQERVAPNEEDPELAARLDAQLGEFFDD